MKDSDLQEARRCLANEETGKAIELYEPLLKSYEAETEAEAKAAIRLCKYYEACKSGRINKDSSSRHELYLSSNKILDFGFEPSIIFSPIALKALQLDPQVPKHWFFRSSDDIASAQDIAEATGAPGSPKRHVSRSARNVRAIPSIVGAFHEIFVRALATEKFDMLPEAEKQELYEEAVELDKLFVKTYIYRHGELHAPKDDTMSEIYKKLRRPDPRTAQCLKSIAWRVGSAVAAIILFIIAVEI